MSDGDLTRSHDGCDGILYVSNPNRGSPGKLMACTDCDYQETRYDD